MEYLFIQRPGDKEQILELLKEFKLYSKEELVARYKTTVKIGIVGAHAQAQMLVALYNAFKTAFGKSPIKVEDNSIIRLTAKMEGYDQSLKNNPSYIEKTLLILGYKMGLIYENDILEFTPSKTYLGNKITHEFAASLKERLVGVETNEDLSKLLVTYENKNNEK